jgi:hypothetical protein
MKTYVTNMLTAVIMFTTTGLCSFSQAAQTKDRLDGIQASEHQIKAAFLYNFIKFTDWPESKVSESNAITIGLLGKNEFGNAFDPIKGKPIQNKQVEIVDFGNFIGFIDSNNSGKLQLTSEVERLRKCHLLFVCNSEKKYYSEIIGAVKGSNVLTVGETEDFLDAGGIITFIPGTEKLVFEISNTAAKEEKIRISSRVLRLARKVRGAESADRMQIQSKYARLDQLDGY